jgi:hypothetical protein
MLVRSNFASTWAAIAARVPGRSARQCRDRWTNYLAPGVSFAPWSPEEDAQIIALVNEHGTRWATIAKSVPGRSDNSIKNRWYSELKQICELRHDGKWQLNMSRERSQETKKVEPPRDDFWQRNVKAIDAEAKVQDRIQPTTVT